MIELLQRIKKELGITELDGFKWSTDVPIWSKIDRHAVIFSKWDGYIYVPSKGLMNYKDYYKGRLESGYCLFIEGCVLSVTKKSDHYRKIQRQYLKTKKQHSKAPLYPVKDRTFEAVFVAAVELFKKGILSEEKLKERVLNYIKEGEQERVFNEVVYHTPLKEAIS